MKKEDIIKMIESSDKYIAILQRMVDDAKEILKNAKTQKEIKEAQAFIKEKESDINDELKQRRIYEELLNQ